MTECTERDPSQARVSKIQISSVSHLHLILSTTTSTVPMKEELMGSSSNLFIPFLPCMPAFHQPLLMQACSFTIPANFSLPPPPYRNLQFRECAVQEWYSHQRYLFPIALPHTIAMGECSIEKKKSKGKRKSRSLTNKRQTQYVGDPGDCLLCDERGKNQIANAET